MNIGSNEFDDLIKSENKTVVVDFWATWCGPCKMLAPVLEEVEKDYPDVVFAKVNVDEETPLAIRFGIQSIPTLLFFKNGEIVKKSVGYSDADELRSIIDNVI